MVYLQETWVRAGWSVHKAHTASLSLRAWVYQPPASRQQVMESITWTPEVSTPEEHPWQQGTGKTLTMGINVGLTVPVPRTQHLLLGTEPEYIIHLWIFIMTSFITAKNWQDIGKTSYLSKGGYIHTFWYFYIVECIRHGSVPDQDLSKKLRSK